MKILNDLREHAPQALIAAANANLQRPEENVFRVTQLIDSPLVRTLAIRHWDELEVPLSKTIPSLSGTAWHEFMAKYAPETSTIESRVTIGFSELPEISLSGSPDEHDQDDEAILDHKTCKTYKYINGDFEYWTRQGNCYALMKRIQGHTINKLYIFAKFEDWTKYKMMGSNSYPRKRMLRIQLPVWDIEKQKEFVTARLRDHIENPMRECTPEERWQSETSYAVMQEGRKTALIATLQGEPITTRQQAEVQMATSPKCQGKTGLYIQERLGERTRCDEWCEVSQHCPFYKTNGKQE